MILQTIDSAESNFPENHFTPEEDTAETGDSDWLALSCCTYVFVPFTIDSIWETDVDE